MEGKMEERYDSQNGVSSRYLPPSGYDYLTNPRYPNNDKHLSPDLHNSGKPNKGIPATGQYSSYPEEQPFIHDSYRRDIGKPVKAYPESNRQAVMSALKSLQEKIRSLEEERKEAESNLHSLTTETNRFKRLVQRDIDITDNDVTQNASYANTTRGTDVQSKLDTAEQRCKLLEKQLDCMRSMVQRAEHDRTESARRTAAHDARQVQVFDDDLRHQIDKISELEREHLKLTATQTLAENKIRDLEEKLREERHHRKYMQTRAAELETAAEAQRILIEANTLQKPKAKKRTKKKQKAAPSRPHSAKTKKPNMVCDTKRPGMEPPEHYKLNLGQIPFISGRSTTPSHSLPANFQEVLSLLKSHNSKLCTSPRSHTKTPGITYFKDKSSGGSKATSRDLTGLLLQLQQEFSTMSFEHQELRDQIAATSEPRLQEDLERELDTLVGKMEDKGRQIEQLRKYTEGQPASRKTRVPHSTAEFPVAQTELPVGGQVQVTTTVRTKARSMTPQASHPAGGPQGSLNLYKGLKKIQNTLRRDDVSWD